ncbi:MAG: enoyl-CoA hydratase/isomerase family protein [Pseudomonadota bacterium]
MTSEPELILRKDGRAGRITLNRPKALNAVTDGMVKGIAQALDEWEQDDEIALLVIDAAGDRAFAAGGDIKDLYEQGRAQNFWWGREFWANEYRMNARIASYPKPIVTVVDGIVMGGGVGVSAHASHRVVTEKTVLAMPECGIGLIPDVGGTFFLAYAPGRLGEFFGLTGTRMGAADAIHTGFADSYVPRIRIPKMIEQLCATGSTAVVAAHVADAMAIREPAVLPLGPVLRDKIDQAFQARYATEIVERLEAMGGEWAESTVKAIRRACPLSVACCLLAIRKARGMTRIEDALANEYRFAWRCSEEGEFLEGIRAAVVDKDRAPKWKLARLEDVTPERAQSMMAPLGDYDLQL